MWVATAGKESWGIRYQFLSTPPVWVATRACAFSEWVNEVSIHATRVGGDHGGGGHAGNSVVSIHATRVGGDERRSNHRRGHPGFYPRHPCGWRPHSGVLSCNHTKRFYPRHPCGWRHDTSCTTLIAFGVSIHATRVGGDSTANKAGDNTAMFLSTPPVWVATTSSSRSSTKSSRFLSTPPVWVATAKVHKNGYTFAQKCEFLLSIYKK